MPKKAGKTPNANWRAGLEFVLGNLKTLTDYLRRDVKAGTFEAEEAGHFLNGPYPAWLEDARAKIEEGHMKDLKSAFLDIDRVTRAFVRLCQYEYCRGKGLELRQIKFWDFENFKWLEEALPDYHPVHRELKELTDSLRPSVGDADLDELLVHADKAEKETFLFHAADEEREGIEVLESELSGKLDDIVKAQEDERAEAEADLPIVDFVEALLTDAAHRGATEIEIIPGPWRGIVQYRIGEEEEFVPHFEIPPAVIRVAIIRLKILASLDIANCDEAQDGRIEKIPSPALVGRKIRLGTTPTRYREKALIRLE